MMLIRGSSSRSNFKEQHRAEQPDRRGGDELEPRRQPEHHRDDRERQQRRVEQARPQAAAERR